MNDPRETITCSRFDCTEQVVSHGYCAAHRAEYMRDWRHSTKPVWSLTRGQAESIAGREITDDERLRIAVAIDNSSVPEALAEVIYQVTKDLAGDPA